MKTVHVLALFLVPAITATTSSSESSNTLTTVAVSPCMIANNVTCDNLFCKVDDSNGDNYIYGIGALLVISISLNIFCFVLFVCCTLKNKKRSTNRANGNISSPTETRQQDQPQMLDFQYMPPQRCDFEMIEIKETVNDQSVLGGTGGGGAAMGRGGSGSGVPGYVNMGNRQYPQNQPPAAAVVGSGGGGNKFKSSYDMISAQYIDEEGGRHMHAQ